MLQVLIEPAKAGSRYDYLKGNPLRKIAFEDLPTHESMKESHTDRRATNFNLGPLERWLFKQVGRPWDDVFSEASKNFKKKSINKLYAKTVSKLLDWFVVRDVEMVGGIPFERNWLNGVHEVGAFKEELYVHPTTKILCKHKMAPVIKVPLPETFRELRRIQKPSGYVASTWFGPVLYWYEAIEKFDGIWYFVIGCATKQSTWRYPRHDDHHVVFKRQLGKKELKQYKVFNDTSK